ncbi:MAG TPA: hypothetical protein VFX48_07005 [Saprospiraceae bacterium]|nr:hypothetical protein [Saprospiraceae bacterium]
MLRSSTMKHLIYLWMLSFNASLAQGWSSGNPLDSMHFYADAMFSLKQASFRNLAEEQFLRLAKIHIRSIEDTSLLKSHPAFIHTESPDRSFYLVSWQTEPGEQQYQYSMFAFQPGSPPLLLRSVTRNIRRINYETCDEKNWYGALYYKVLPPVAEGRYTVLGFRLTADGKKHRIIDVIQFAEQSVRFGSPVFQVKNQDGTEDLLFRKVISYSPSANLVVTFDELNQTLFYDHVTTHTDPQTGELLLIPDGTFEAFEWKAGLWLFNDYLQLQKIDTPPSSKPAGEQKDKDLFGRPKSKIK